MFELPLSAKQANWCNMDLFLWAWYHLTCLLSHCVDTGQLLVYRFITRSFLATLTNKAIKQYVSFDKPVLWQNSAAFMVSYQHPWPSGTHFCNLLMPNGKGILIWVLLHWVARHLMPLWGSSMDIAIMHMRSFHPSQQTKQFFSALIFFLFDIF